MSTPEDHERRIRRLEIGHADTRWLAARGDRDIADLRIELANQGRTLQEHTHRFDSLDLQMRSLTQMVGEVLKRLSEPPPVQGAPDS
jgi:hypothetical protein